MFRFAMEYSFVNTSTIPTSWPLIAPNQSWPMPVEYIFLLSPNYAVESYENPSAQAAAALRIHNADHVYMPPRTLQSGCR